MNECKPHARMRMEILPSGAEYGQEAQVVVALFGRNKASSAGSLQEGAGDPRTKTWRYLTLEFGRDDKYPRGVGHFKPWGTG
jgi:hypothetical protein